MGQYKQWLHYRGIDQLLRSQLAVSEHELEQLQAQVEVLSKQPFPSENVIFQALLKLQQTQKDAEYSTEEPISQPEAGVSGITEPQKEQVDEFIIEEVQELEATTISPALSAWSRLPNFDAQIIQEPEINSSSSPIESLPPQPREHLLPPDIVAFVEASYPTNPQIKIPWWLQNIASTRDEVEVESAERQSEQADYLVQRWFERWGPRSRSTKRAQEDQTL